MKRYDYLSIFHKMAGKERQISLKIIIFWDSLVSDDNILITIQIARVDVRVNWASD